jgi:serine/threonine protein kinase
MGLLSDLFKDNDHKDFSTLFRNLLEKMLDKDPGKRPTAFKVWKMTKEILNILNLEPHCQCLSGAPVDPEPRDNSSSDSEEELEHCFPPRKVHTFTI